MATRRSKKQEPEIIEEEELEDELPEDDWDDEETETPDDEEWDEEEEDEEDEAPPPPVKKNKPAPSKKERPSKKANKKRRATASQWDEELDRIDSESANSEIFYPKKGRTRFRIVAHESATDENGSPQFYTKVTSYYNGKARTKYLLAVQILASEAGELSDLYAGKQVAMMVPKSIISKILVMLSEGWEIIDYGLADLNDGFEIDEQVRGLTLRKTGEGLKTEYDLTQSPKHLELLDADLVPMSRTLDELGEMSSDNSEARDREQNPGLYDADDAPRSMNSKSSTSSMDDDWDE